MLFTKSCPIILLQEALICHFVPGALFNSSKTKEGRL